MNTENWEIILEQAQEGDSRAFRKLYDYSYSVVQAECNKLLNHNRQDTEDAIQETYIKIYKNLNAVKDVNRFKSWCRTIAHNESVDIVKSRRRKTGKDDFRPPVSSDEYIGMDALDNADSEALPEDQAEQEMVRDLLQQAVNNLGPQRAMCFALYRQGVPYRDISERLSIPLGSVKSHVHYAKTAIRKEIERIEKQEQIQIHGFVLVPTASGNVLVRAPGGQGAGFFTAQTMSTGTREKVWKQVSKSVSPRKAASLWKKIVASVLAAAVIAGGVAFGISQNNKNNITAPVNGGRNTAQSNSAGEDDNSQNVDFVQYVTDSSQLSQKYVRKYQKALNKQLRQTAREKHTTPGKIIEVGFSRANDMTNVKKGHTHNSLVFVVQQDTTYEIYEYADIRYSEKGILDAQINNGRVRTYSSYQQVQQYIRNKPGDRYQYKSIEKT